LSRLSAEALAARLDALPGVFALTKQQLIENDQAFIGDVFNKPLWLMVGIAFFVGTLVVGLVTYTATVERQREYGVLKAIGAGNRGLYTVVAGQALIATLAGAFGGVVLAFGASALIEQLRPQFLVLIEPFAIARSLVAGLAIALLAALAPARVIAGLAPADVFRR
jgi:ABC-type antimicrobial peptide transport system permease subunit